MSVDVAEDFEVEVTSLDITDTSAVRALAIKLDALADPPRASQLCARSNALRRALGQVRADNLASLLARDAREEFIRRTADAAYMAPVDLASLRVPRYVAVAEHPCPCGTTLMVPYPRHGGPGYCFDCPACAAPYLVRVAYAGTEYAAQVEPDTRPAKKRKKREPVL